MKEYYLHRYIYDPSRSEVWKAIVEDLSKYIRSSDTVIDIGCGFGDFISQVNCKERIAVDINRNEWTNFSERIKFIHSDSSDLNSIPRNSVDVVFSSNLFEHLNKHQLDLTLKEIYRIMRPGSKLIIIQPNYRYCYREYFDDYTHISVFSHISLSDLLKTCHFIPIKIVPRYLPLTMKSRLPKNYWLTKLYLKFPFKFMGKQMLLVFQK